MSRGHAKGSSFERAICKALGRWWTNGQRDDVFWRSSNSGGRAKTRSQHGQSTFGQYGDVQATDPIGQPLMDLCTIEVKRGYNHASIGDMLDLGPKRAKQPWALWMEQVMADQTNAKRPFWMLITKRDQREAVVFLPKGFYDLLRTAGSKIHISRPLFRIKLADKTGVVYALQLSHFFAHVRPDNIAKATQTYAMAWEGG